MADKQLRCAIQRPPKAIGKAVLSRAGNLSTEGRPFSQIISYQAGKKQRGPRDGLGVLSAMGDKVGKSRLEKLFHLLESEHEFPPWVLGRPLHVVPHTVGFGTLTNPRQYSTDCAAASALEVLFVS